MPVTVRNVDTKLPAKFVGKTPPKLQPGESQTTTQTQKLSFSFFWMKTELATDTVRARGLGEDESGDVILQPGNSTVQVFTLRTLNALFFVPSLYNLNIEIEYLMDNQSNHDTVSYQMNIRSPLGAIISGAVVGSIVGYIVRTATDEAALQRLFAPTGTSLVFLRFFVGLVAAVLIGAMVVVAFARKKDAQPILSIEDFWGGLFIGFLSAYGGDALLMKVAGKTA